MACVSRTLIVADNDFPLHLDVERVELFGDVKRIGIDFRMGQEFGPDGDDLRVTHSLIRYGRGRPSIPTSTLKIELLVASTSDFDGENARPTIAGPDRNSSADASGVMRTTPAVSER